MVPTSTINEPSIPDPSGACFYLDLPRELWDMIHEYALTYDDGLVCAHIPINIKNGNMWLNMCTYSTALLYNIKLSPSHSHSADCPPPISINGNLLPGDPNPLRLVCHQTRAETKGLLLKYNPITFRPEISLPDRETYEYADEDEDDDKNFGDGDTMAKLFNDFYNQCSAVNKAHLRKIIIHAANDDNTCDDELLGTFTHYANRYPNNPKMIFILRFQLDDVDESLRDYSAQARALGMARRGTSPLSWPEDDAYIRILFWWYFENDITLEEWKAVSENVRFLIVEEFPEQFRGLLEKCMEEQGECTFEKDMAAARKVFEEGI
jgi:hypothetical protein